MLEVKNLNKSFGNKKVLKKISFNVETGDRLAIIGPSGCGKSTCLRCLNLLEKPTSGDIYFHKTNITKLKDLENEQLILPIPGTANRNDLDKLLIKNEVKFKDILNIHTSEMIISAIKKGLGIGYLIYNLVENDIEKNDLEVLNIKEKLPTVEINILYDKELLTTTSKKFIKDYIEYNF